MLKIKLSRIGKKGFASYKIIVAEARSKRDGRFVDSLGHYQPHTNPPTVKLDRKKLQHWLERGAQPTKVVRSLIKQHA